MEQIEHTPNCRYYTVNPGGAKLPIFRDDNDEEFLTKLHGEKPGTGRIAVLLDIDDHPHTVGYNANDKLEINGVVHETNAESRDPLGIGTRKLIRWDLTTTHFSVDDIKHLESFIYDTVKSYATALAIETTEKMTFIGSGTFIQWNHPVYGTQYGILTADHVLTKAAAQLDVSRDSQQLLRIILEEKWHAFGVEAKSLKVIRIRDSQAGEYEEWGPDLAVILLPNGSKIETIRAKKGFWNLSKHTATRITLSQSPAGFMLIAGHPGEDKKELNDATFIPGLIGFTNRENYFEKNNLDYIDVLSLRTADNAAPKSYSGVSGGGLWQAHVSKKEDNSMSLHSVTLAGVAFFQIYPDKQDCNKIIVRSHGPVTIYQELLNRLTLTHFSLTDL